MSDGKNDVHWRRLFEEHKILEAIDEQGHFRISSKQINVEREARLMTKFDFRDSLPTIFKNNNLSILPVTRGEYVISDFDAYHTFTEQETLLTSWHFPDSIQSIDYTAISSEPIALHTAYLTGMLEDFVGDQEMVPTVSGRMGSGSFSFQIRRHGTEDHVAVEIANSQLEIDGGYEGVHSLVLVEAKNTISKDFLIRQLYYPYRLWTNKGVTKTIRPVFLVYSNGVFSFYEYGFTDSEVYNSLSLVRHKRYRIEDPHISLADLEQISDTVEFVPEPVDEPFPQADSFERVINICELLYENEALTADEIRDNYDFDMRQASYYAAAGRYLELFRRPGGKRGVGHELSDKGRSLFAMTFRERNLMFARLILQHEVFHRVFRESIEQGRVPSKERVVEIMQQCKLQVNGQTTYERRSSTIIGWIGWVLRLIEE